MVTVERIWGTGDQGHKGRGSSESLPPTPGEAREVEMPADVGGGPDRVHSERGKGKMHRWLPFCQEMPDPAAGQGHGAQLHRFPGPHGPWGPFCKEGMVLQATPDPTRDSFLPGPGVGPVCVCVCTHV